MPIVTKAGVEKLTGLNLDNVNTMGVDGLITMGDTATDAKLLGTGTSTTRYAMGTTAGDAVKVFVEGTHTTGDSRAINVRNYFSGVGGSGEAVKAYGIVNNVTAATGGTVNGAHISLDVSGANGKISGAGNALRATLGLRDTSVSGGTVSAIQIDSNFATGATVPATASAIRVTNTDVGLWANLLNIPNVASGGMLAAHITQTMTHSIRIISADGTKYYIMCTNAATNRTGGA